MNKEKVIDIDQRGWNFNYGSKAHYFEGAESLCRRKMAFIRPTGSLYSNSSVRDEEKCKACKRKFEKKYNSDETLKAGDE